MGFSALGEKIWPVTPDWSAGVQEALAWSTEVLHASATAVSQHRALPFGPRRSFTFEVLSAGQERRAAEMLLAGHKGPWQLPIWPDVQWLNAALAGGAEEIPCATAGFDFVEGGRAVLYRSLQEWELVEIDAIEADHLVLAEPTAGAYGRGDRLYPLRQARVQGGAEEQLGNDNTGRRSITFHIDEPCDWPALEEPTLYLTHPVLDVPPEESQDPASSVERLEHVVDFGTGLPFVHDLAGVALRAQQTRWLLSGREEHTWFRSLLYTLAGRRTPMWVPSFASDLHAAATVTGGSTSLTVEWAGYTLFGLNKPNRRDLRIQLDDGTTLYRRVTAAVEGGGTETLTLSSALDAGSIASSRIRRISFMALSTLAADQIQIEHETDADGLARVGLAWRAVVPDV